MKVNNSIFADIKPKNIFEKKLMELIDKQYQVRLRDVRRELQRSIKHQKALLKNARLNSKQNGNIQLP